MMVNNRGIIFITFGHLNDIHLNDIHLNDIHLNDIHLNDNHLNDIHLNDNHLNDTQNNDVLSLIVTLSEVKIKCCSPTTKDGESDDLKAAPNFKTLFRCH
jgi:hypothetical protein